MRNALPLLALLLTGCGASGPAPVEIVAIDTSGSAREFFPAFERAARDVNESLPPGGTLELYRFDTGVNEIHVGEAMDAAVFKRTLKAALAKDRGEHGTSLLKLVTKLDERVRLHPERPTDLTICTDCGVEEMKPADHEGVKRIVAGWKTGANVRKVDLVGVRPLHHEALRADFSPLESRLTIR